MEKKRPTMLIVAVVLLILVGFFGVIGGCLGASSALMQGSLMQFNEQLLQNTPGGAEQLEAQRELMAVQAQFTVPSVIAQLINLVGSAALIAAAGLLVGLKRSGASLLMAATGACILADLITAALGGYIAYASQDAMAMAARAPGAAGVPMDAIMQGTMIASVCWLFIWFGIKVSIYVFGVVTSRKPEVQQLLA